MIRVSTRRGVIELASRQDDAIPDGVVFIPFAYVEAAANLLTNPALDPFGKIPEFKYCAAKVERVGSAAGSGRVIRARAAGFWFGFARCRVRRQWRPTQRECQHDIVWCLLELFVTVWRTVSASSVRGLSR